MTGSLQRTSRIADPDEFYARLISLHHGLSPEESNVLNGKLILVMAHYIGEGETLEQLLAMAQGRPLPPDAA